MNTWFTVEVLAEDTFAISEYQHWEESHCYLLCGSQRAVLIDSGLGVSDIQAVVQRLTKLPLEVLTTHAHWDHIGGHESFEKVAVFESEQAWLAGHFPLPLKQVKEQLTRGAANFPEGFALSQYKLPLRPDAKLLFDGLTIDLGGRTLEVLHTPGHSPGHCCFYEASRQSLYAGDLLYQGCLDAYYPTTDPASLKQSVEKVSQLPLAHIWPGHHQLRLPADFAHRVRAGFQILAEQGKLWQGAGIFDFGDYQIHI